jgi:octaprenyl-diphosphate synthase
MPDLKAKILSEVEQDLADIESALAENLNPHLQLVKDVAGHILFSGGKRLRPLLMVLSARLCGYTGHYDKTFSTALEFLHTATLLHDDVVDEATLRRGREVAHARWGPAITVLVGDYLLARAMSISVGTGSLRVMQILAKLTETMSQGEVYQLMRKGDLDVSEEDYLNVIRQKTAVLFEAACEVSAIIAAASSEKEMALTAYGYNLGIAFQMADDLLDYTLTTADFGKEVGTDLREGKLTLPVIHALGRANASDRERMSVIIGNNDFSVDEFKELTGLLENYGGIDYTWRKAAGYIDRAKDALSVFKDSRTKQTLMDIADYTLQRRV